MNDEQELPDDLEKLMVKLIAKFRRLPLEGKRKSLATIDAMIADEPDAESVESLEKIKSDLEKEGAK